MTNRTTENMTVLFSEDLRGKEEEKRGNGEKIFK
jgi:hypothetical protein